MYVYFKKGKEVIQTKCYQNKEILKSLLSEMHKCCIHYIVFFFFNIYKWLFWGLAC